MNAVEIEEAISALAKRPFDTAAFPFAFLQSYSGGNWEFSFRFESPLRRRLFQRKRE